MSLPTQSPFAAAASQEEANQLLNHLLQFTQPLQPTNLSQNATSLSPSSTYYGSDFSPPHFAASPATIFSPPVKTPLDPSTSHYHPNQPETSIPLFPSPTNAPPPTGPTVAGPPVQTQALNTAAAAPTPALPGPSYPTRFEYKHPNYQLPPDFGYYPSSTQLPPPPPPTNPAIITPPNHSSSLPAPISPPQPNQEIAPLPLTINDLLSVCPRQDVDELRDRDQSFSHDVSLQQLHLRLMWKWYRERSRPSNEDLLKFHRPLRRNTHTSKGTGSRGGAEGYTCLWPGCTKQDQPSRSDRAQEHALLHLGLKPFACDACGAEFTRHNELKRHDKTCKSKKMYAMSADDLTLFATSHQAASTSRRNTLRLPSMSKQSRSTNTANGNNGKKMRALRGVSTDPSSGANSPTSPLATRAHLSFTPITVESQDPSSFFLQSPHNTSNPNLTSNPTVNPSGQAFNTGAQVGTNRTHGGV